MKPLGLYIHFPFCVQKCHYCDFNSYSGMNQYHEAYIEALIKELAQYKHTLAEYEIQSVFMGGGTPSLLSPELMHQLMQTIQNDFSLSAQAEISMEANPGTLSPQKLEGYLESGINRLSFGLQACQNHLLNKLGRIHRYEDFLSNLQYARKIGFQNINVDLMFALPQQELAEWKETLDEIVSLSIPHISAYSLIWEEGTQFYDWWQKKELEPLDEELELEMFHHAIDYLKKMGYDHYEISNFAKTGHRCTHNQIYWKNQPYLGVGAGAHSNFAHIRFNNEVNLLKYMKKIEENHTPVVEKNLSSFSDQVSETMFLGLRMMEGISIGDFTKRFAISPLVLYTNQLKKFTSEGLLQIAGDRISLTSRGIDLSNLVFQELLLD